MKSKADGVNARLLTFEAAKQSLTLARLVSTLLSPPLVAGVTFLTLLAFDKPSD